LFSKVRVFKFLCHRVGGREEERIKTAQEIGTAGTPFNAVIEQFNVPLVHLAPPDHVMVTKLDKTAQLQPERALSHDFNAVTLEHLYRLRDVFSMTSPSHSARTPLSACECSDSGCQRPPRARRLASAFEFV
jgi:hypothetical protein